MTSVIGNLAHVHRRIAQVCAAAGRSVDSVTLLAVSKTFPAEAVREAFGAGQRQFGENYVQEALDKIAALADLRGPINAGPSPVDVRPPGGAGAARRPWGPVEWHLIGPLQSNKTRPVAAAFDWVHSVDRLKIAQRLSEQRPPDLPPLQLCLQVNISGEASKSGLLPTEVAAVALAVAALPRLRLRGLMAIPEPAADLEAQRAPHRALRELLAAVNLQGLAATGAAWVPLDTLSMGMSADLEAAVAEGATIVRVGTAIFGGRAASVR